MAQNDLCYFGMEEVKNDKTCKGFADRLTLGITRVLENLPGVLDVWFVEKPPAEKRCLLSWEQKNNCALPEDLRDFYLTTDGFMLSWNTKLGNEVVPVGCMMISSVAQLRPLIQSNVYSIPNTPTLADLNFDDDLEELDGPEKPHFDSCCRIFELDPCNAMGRPLPAPDVPW
ncbi:tubulin polyglutamylase complex subunit 2 isoform X2 [Carassius gibelio]|uniref:tubulin polyglutamylase complex subunit 2 isoform X2 n=1 Tax=Carassius gibelio TaxID=101364 RepID=UPI0022799D37|nr:tubulin polyglutamylase complex subunit 2 isoform X2 [Carassius gibelio]